MTSDKDETRNGHSRLEDDNVVMRLLRMLEVAHRHRLEADAKADAADQERTTIQRYWEHFAADMINDDASEAQMQDMRIAFNAGALCGFSIVYNAFDSLKPMTKGSAEYKEEHERINRWILRREREVAEAAKELVKIKLMKDHGIHGIDPDVVDVVSFEEALRDIVNMLRTTMKKEKKE